MNNKSPIRAREKIICVDTETTGFDFNEDEVIQLSIINGNGDILFNEYFKPKNKAQWPEAAAVNGIYPEMVAEKRTIAEYIPQINRIFSEADLIVGYNHEFFDMKFLKNAGITVPETIGSFDVMKEFAREYGEWDSKKGRYKWKKLCFCASYYGYSGSGNFHDSLEDVRATLYSYYAMVAKDKSN